MMLADDAIGDIEMIQNPLDQSKRRKQFGGKEGEPLVLLILYRMKCRSKQSDLKAL